MSTASDEKFIVDELQRLVDKVEEMKTQRALLMLQLRESLRNDDITDQIAHNDEEKNAFPMMVQKEIAKHQNEVGSYFVIAYTRLFRYIESSQKSNQENI